MSINHSYPQVIKYEFEFWRHFWSRTEGETMTLFGEVYQDIFTLTLFAGVYQDLAPTAFSGKK